jgi:hypothetical protein
MRLGKEQAAGYVEDTGYLEDTGPLAHTGADSRPAEEVTAGQAGEMPLTTAAEPPLIVS